MNTVKLSAKINVPAADRMLLIAGPCQIESYEHCAKIAETLIDFTQNLPIDLVFKSSFDKANRTSLNTQRGPGLEQGLEILAKIRKNFNLPVLTDIHSIEQVVPTADVVDVLQIPAFLCRQTDLLIAAGKTGRAINVKKGQFLAPEDMQFCIEKISSTGNNNILLCERGTCFGYRDLVVDMRSLVIMQKFGYPVIFDATHSVQSMGGGGGKSGGSREFIPTLASAAIATGVAGVFIECHDQPDRAPSDAASMLPIDQLPGLLGRLLAIRKAIG